jgi:ribosomal protein S18 acetylase RimI-like enzyme
VRALPPLPAGVVLRQLVELETAGVNAALLRAGIERIFRATAARWPDDAAAAHAFQRLWLDQYFEHERELVTLALTREVPASEHDVLGYVVGCRIDPATSERFTALSYFRDFAALTPQFPAHLHINLDARTRGEGVGAHLVEALCARLKREGVSGVHVVTGRDQRNVSFYTRLGFVERARAPRGSTEVLFLARALAS